MTKVEAIIKVMQDNGGIANWNILYNELERYYPEIRNAVDWQAGVRGVLYREINKGKNFKKVDNGLFALLNYDEDNLLLKDKELSGETVSERIVKTRLNQNKLREQVLKELRFCPITNIDDKRLLIVSHIKPWAFSNNDERLDRDNTLLLSPLFDKLFDTGLITFSDAKEIIFSNALSAQNRQKVGIDPLKIITTLPLNEHRQKYLEYHREKIFIH